MKAQTRSLRLLLVGATAVSVAGCTVMKISGRSPIPLILNQPQAKVEVIRRVNRGRRIVFDYTGSFDVSEVLSEISEGSDADALINVTITMKSTLVDSFINIATFGIARASTFVVSGDLVRAPTGLGAVPGSNRLALAESTDIRELLALSLELEEGDCTMIVRVDEGIGGKHYRLVRYRIDAREGRSGAEPVRLAAAISKATHTE